MTRGTLELVVLFGALAAYLLGGVTEDAGMDETSFRATTVAVCLTLAILFTDAMRAIRRRR